MKHLQQKQRNTTMTYSQKTEYGTIFGVKMK